MAVPMKDEDREQLSVHEARLVRIEEQIGELRGEVAELRSDFGELRRVAFPRLGRMPVGEVTSADVIETLRPVWHARPTTAQRVLQRVGVVMEWAMAMGYRTTNPCGRMNLMLGRQRPPGAAHAGAAAPRGGAGGGGAGGSGPVVGPAGVHGVRARRPPVGSPGDGSGLRRRSPDHRPSLRRRAPRCSPPPVEASCGGASTSLAAATRSVLPPRTSVACERPRIARRAVSPQSRTR